MNTANVREQVIRLRDTEGTVAAADLDTIWSGLHTIAPEEMFGSWKGSEFTTGHPLEGEPAKINWYGKIFNSVYDVHPIVCRQADGTLFSNVEQSKGAASLWNVEFRGEMTATMVYDGMAILDHFKRVDADTVLGIMNGKEGVANGQHYYFLLERDEDPRPLRVRQVAV